jgi:hypothetical protein
MSLSEWLSLIANASVWAAVISAIALAIYIKMSGRK